MKVREHRGGFAASMRTAVEIDPTIEAVAAYFSERRGTLIHHSRIEVTDFGHGVDARNGWNTHLVSFVDDSGVLGITDGPVGPKENNMAKMTDPSDRGVEIVLPTFSVYKYPIKPEGVRLDLPAGARLLSVQMQRGTPCLWALVPTGDPVMPITPSSMRIIRVYGTGHTINGDPGEFIDTFQIEGLVFHVFDATGQGY